MSRYDSSNNSISDCNWTFTSDNTRIGRAITDIGRSPVTDYSLQDCGIYVKTVDFSNDWEDAAYWRSIHENSTITGGGISPRLAITAPSDSASALIGSPPTAPSIPFTFSGVSSCPGSMP